MSPKRYLTSTPVTGGVLLTCLLMAGCATEKTMTEQTQPLRDQIVQLEKALAESKQAASRASQDQSSANQARQTSLDQFFANVKAVIQSMQDKLNGQGERITHNELRLDELATTLPERLAQLEQRMDDVAAAARETGSQMGVLKQQQDADAIAGAALTGRVAQTEARLNELATTLPQRLNQAEQRLKVLSDSVQEALALAAKEIFLANGREAFTVTLTEDKVLYPLNDPALDKRDAAKLDDLAARLAKLDQEYHLDIQGHTDNNSTDDNNYNLGKARGEVVKRYLHEKDGISISRMSVISYGANKPLDPAGGHNRRIFIRVLVLK